MKPTLDVIDFTENFNRIISKFKRDAVLVGIPEDESATRDENGKTPEGEPINNAALLAINEFGSPAANIPARPVMSIGIRSAQKEIAEQFKKAVTSALSEGFKAVDLYYNRAGIIASNAVKKTINLQEGFAGPSEATLKARAAQGFKGTKALVVTAQMRNAITYVVKGGG